MTESKDKRMLPNGSPDPPTEMTLSSAIQKNTLQKHHEPVQEKKYRKSETEISTSIKIEITYCTVLGGKCTSAQPHNFHVLFYTHHRCLVHDQEYQRKS